MYFVDIKRGSVLRLSQDGFTPISDYKMREYFTDKATQIYAHTTMENRFNIYGVYDIRFNEYIISFEESQGCPPGSLGPTWDCVSGVCIKYCDDSGAFNWPGQCSSACPPIDPGGGGNAQLPPPSGTGDVGRTSSYNRKKQIEVLEREKLKEGKVYSASGVSSTTSDTTESSDTTSSDTSTTY